VALDFYDNGRLSTPRCAECDGFIHSEDGQWKHDHFVDKLPRFWGKVADEEESGESQTGLGSFFSDLRNSADGKFKDTLHPAAPHDGRTIAQDDARKELEHYDLVAHPESEGYTKEDVEGKVDIEPKLFGPESNVSRQFARYVSPPQNRRDSTGPGRS
jgi:hypothetical protein